MTTTPLSSTSRSLPRRGFLSVSAAAIGAASMPSSALLAEPQTKARKAAAVGFRRYSVLLETVKTRGHTLRVLGYCPDGSPVVAVKAGGEKEPAIFISAGSHSTEHAGVAAAVELLDELKTEHQVYVIPCRDPMGRGYRDIAMF